MFLVLQYKGPTRSLPESRRTTHSTAHLSSWSSPRRYILASANRLSATTSLVCWLLGMVPGCLVGTRWGTIVWGHPRSQAALSSPCFVAPVLACLLACLLAQASPHGLWPVARPTGQVRSSILDCGLLDRLRPSVVTPRAGSIGKQGGQR